MPPAPAANKTMRHASFEYLLASIQYIIPVELPISVHLRWMVSNLCKSDDETVELLVAGRPLSAGECKG